MSELKIIRPAQLAEILSMSPVTIWRMEKRGELPPRKKISDRCVGWLEKDILKWMKSRPNSLLIEDEVPEKPLVIDVIVPPWILKRTDLTPGAKLLYSLLYRECRKEYPFQCSFEDLAILFGANGFTTSVAIHELESSKDKLLRVEREEAGDLLFFIRDVLK